MFCGEREQTDAGERREAVRLALTSGRTWREIADVLGIGRSMLTRWPGQKRAMREPSEPPVLRQAELKRLPRENAALTQERDLSKELWPSSRKRDVAGERHWFERPRRG